MGNKSTAPAIRAMKAAGKPIVCITAYDAVSGALADQAGVDLILVGDSVGNVVLGYETTVPVTMADMLHHLSAVRRSVKNTLLVADMPFGSYQASVEQAVNSAVAFMQAGAEAVKLEGPYGDAISAIARAGIPIMGHVGMTPQSVHAYGGFKIQGKGDAADAVLEAARVVEDAGAFSIVLELIPAALATSISKALTIPTIGIGAGAGCDGQIQVFHDLVGLSPYRFKHAKRYVEGWDAFGEGIAAYAKEVREGTFPGAGAWVLRVVRTISELALPWGKEFGFVPTMGALHEGHLALMRRAKAECGFCVASIFVNPKQFGPTEDFARYPRPESKDFEMARAAGVDAMFAPSVEEIYPKSVTTVHVGGVTERWEGESRPGHFDGVTTVVAKLFNIIRPTQAFFGWKDFQQCVVIERMVSDLNIPVSLRFADTVREADGLALSSRNVYLSVEHRAIASQLYRVLTQCAQRVKDAGLVEVCLEDSVNELEKLGFEIHYFVLIDRNTLEPLTEPVKDARLIAAVKLGNTRLIDNISIA